MNCEINPELLNEIERRLRVTDDELANKVTPKIEELTIATSDKIEERLRKPD